MSEGINLAGRHHQSPAPACLGCATKAFKLYQVKLLLGFIDLVSDVLSHPRPKPPLQASVTGWVALGLVNALNFNASGTITYFTHTSQLYIT